LGQVFLNALEGYVPVDITKTLKAFLDFCYIARQNVLTEDSLNALDAALERFHHYREIFRTSGVRPNGFSLPRQHSLKHYRRHIENFGAPNGLCSSITESKHITAVKKPWRRSNRYEALKQMLTINTRNDKLAAARVDFASRGMLQGTCLGETLKLWHDDLGDNTGNDDEDQSDGPDGNGEGGIDLDIDQDDNNNNSDGNDDGPLGPVDGPPIFSEVSLAQKKGIEHFVTSHKLYAEEPQPSTKVPLFLIPSTRRTHRSSEPRRPCSSVSFLPTTPNVHWNPSSFSLSNHRGRREDLCLPLSNRCLLRPKQPLRHWWPISRDNPMHSTVANG
jgi:hypothetical protein